MSKNLSSMVAPSAALLRAILQPTRCGACQTRAASNYVPRAKYARITALDKLHRKQKVDLRQERLESVIRARSMPEPPFTLTMASSSLLTPPESEEPPESANTAPTAPSSTMLPYTITRTPSHELPIYQKAKGGGTKHITTLRKLSGDLAILQVHIRDALGLEPFFVDRAGRKKETVAINHRTRQIVVRGWRGPEIKKWAQMVGF